MKVLAIVGTRRNEGLVSRMCGAILKGVVVILPAHGRALSINEIIIK